MSGIKKVLKVWNYKAGYQVRTEVHDGSYHGTKDLTYRTAYTMDGGYIGTPVSAQRKARRYGITQWEKAAPDHNTVSIGFSPEEQKWYGWSHRAIYGFGVGDTCEKGDCGYIAKDKDEYLETMIAWWWDDEYHEKTWGEHGTHREKFVHYVEDPNASITGALMEQPGSEEIGPELHGVWIHSLYNNKAPNQSLHGTVNDRFSEYPKFGKGRWTAKTIEDAKQMAKDFADGVS